jgi:hypothetical protein
MRLVLCPSGGAGSGGTRRDPNAGLLGDLPVPRVDSIASEHRHCGLEEGVGVASRVSALLRGLRRRGVGGTLF